MIKFTKQTPLDPVDPFDFLYKKRTGSQKTENKIQNLSIMILHLTKKVDRSNLLNLLTFLY